MFSYLIRAATPEDAAAITALHCSHVRVWRRGGTGEPVPYEALTPRERWLHGGPWMDVQTCAAHLAEWQRAGHLALLALADEEVVGEAEFVEDTEPPPYGHVLHLSLLFVHAAYLGSGVGRALVEAGVAVARERGCAALTTQPEREAEPFTVGWGLSRGYGCGNGNPRPAGPPCRPVSVGPTARRTLPGTDWPCGSGGIRPAATCGTNWRCGPWRGSPGGAGNFHPSG